MNKCPPVGQLELLLEDQLDSAIRMGVACHVETCLSCQEWLERLTGGFTSLGKRRHPGATPEETSLELGTPRHDSVADLAASDGPSGQLPVPVLEANVTGPYLPSPERNGEREEESEPNAGGGQEAAASAAPPASVAPPQVPGYDLLTPLGRGGMGVVYKARQRQLDRLVAVKMIRATDADEPQYRERFLAEAQAVARLRHPNVLQIYEIGEADGLPFFALELLDGGNLDDRLGGAPQAARPAAELLATLARAIHAAHQVGIVHRDLKPANVLFTADGTPKVADFGLARRLDVEVGGQTQAGQVMGSPHYMAPEQARGESHDAGPAADVYALGAILYELLTGRVPLQGTNVLETLRLVLEAEPVAPQRLQPGVPRDLETICLKCLQKEPGKRYDSAAALADDLDRFLAGRPIRARRTPWWERTWKWTRRRPAIAALVGAVLLAVMGGSVGALFYGLYKDQQAAASERDREQLRNRLERRQKIDDACNAGQSNEDAGRFALAKEHWDRALGILDGEPDPSLEYLRGGIEEHRRRVQQHLGKEAAERRSMAAREQLRERHSRFHKHAEDVLTREISVSERDKTADAVAIRDSAAATLKEWGLTAESRPEEAARALERYRQHFESPQQLNQAAAMCYAVLLVWAEAEATPLPDQGLDSRRGGLRRALGLLELAAALGKAHELKTPRALHARRARYLALLGEENAARAEEQLAHRAQASTSLDLFLTALDDFREGRLSRAVRACEVVLQRDADHFWAQYLHALCRMKEGKWAEARAELMACLFRKPDFFWARQLRAVASSELDDELDAAADFAAALGQTTGDNLKRWVVLTNRGVMWARRHQWDKAITDLKKGILLQPDAYQGYVTLVRAYEGLLQKHVAVGVVAGGVPSAVRGDARRKDLDDVVTGLGQALKRRPNDAWLYHVQAQFHLLRGKRDLAQDDFNRAIAREPRGSTSTRLASDYVELGRLQHRAGEYHAALASFDAALGVVPDHPPAHRQRAETLLKLAERSREAGQALDRYREAGQALDRYLAKGKPTWEVHQARGLIHLKLGNYSDAVDSFSRALNLKQDGRTLRSRGWVYLKLNATVLALADFEAAVQLSDTDADARWGRGLARARLGRLRALEDADAALRQGPRTPQFLLKAARIYSQAAGQMEATQAERPDGARERARYQARAVELLGDALERVPSSQRGAFWRENIRNDADLVPVRRSPGMLDLAGRYAP